MTIAKYCYNQKMNLEQYNNFKNNITAAAQAILSGIKQNYVKNTGMYFDTSEILPIIPGATNIDIHNFIIQELKILGVEFINDNTEWRF